ncbi:SRPBCC family protein [Pelagibacterium lentulum]|uniref:ATPase n=1 Tax=Pelagibacterium lentulum TaxID=2029865 RepID=A0A916W164_9HYPH|nr:SRPBCC family protein [Pelagibacterium lentulum]GGA58404.1 ATPase [Pelagibacterium lentulum]
MSIDFPSHLGAVSRTIIADERDGKPVRNVILARSYTTGIDDLWDAITNPERLPRWFLPVSGDLKQGGHYQFEGNAGGTITRCEPPRLVAVTWEFGGGVSWVEVTLAADSEEQTRLSLTHICPLDEFWEQYGPGAVGVGWDLGFLGLGLYLAGASRDQFDESAFAASPEGGNFIAGASQSWMRAAIQAGEDTEQAKAAAKRTTDFYTGANQ